MSNIAVLTGATGEVGKNILKNLLKENYYTKIYILGRKSIEKIADNDKIEKIIINYEKLNFDTKILENADVFSALGTGTTGEYERIDYRYPLSLASKCDSLVKSFNLVSAMGANAKSPSYYQKIKGKAEKDLKKYNLGILRIYRPSMLIAPNRENLIKKEAFFIKVFQILNPLFVGLIKNWKGIKPEVVAKAMVKNAICDNKQQLYKYEDMIKFE